MVFVKVILYLRIYVEKITKLVKAGAVMYTDSVYENL